MRNHRDRQRQLSLQETSMKSEIKKTGGPKVKGMPRSPLSRLPMRSDFKRPGASAANAADCASSIHQMKSNTEELFKWLSYPGQSWTPDGGPYCAPVDTEEPGERDIDRNKGGRQPLHLRA